jgi:hypothetical protein
MLELGQEKPIVMPHQMLDTFVQIGKSTGNTELEWTPFANLLRTAVEAVVCSPSIVLVRGKHRHVWCVIINGHSCSAWFTCDVGFLVVIACHSSLDVGRVYMGRGHTVEHCCLTPAGMSVAQAHMTAVSSNLCAV